MVHCILYKYSTVEFRVPKFMFIELQIYWLWAFTYLKKDRSLLVKSRRNCSVCCWIRGQQKPDNECRRQSVAAFCRLSLSAKSHINERFTCFIINLVISRQLPTWEKLFFHLRVWNILRAEEHRAELQLWNRGELYVIYVLIYWICIRSIVFCSTKLDS